MRATGAPLPTAPSSRLDSPPRPQLLDADPQREATWLTRLYQASIDAIVVVDGDGSITAFNPAAEAMFGHTEATAVGHDLAALLIPAEYRERHYRGFASLRRTGESPILGRRVPVPALRADGTTFPAELTIAQVANEPVRFAAFVRDITEERAREAALQQLADDNAQLIEAAGDGIYRIDLGGRISHANPAAAEILGYDEPLSLIGQAAHALLHHSHEDGTDHSRATCPIFGALVTGDVAHVTRDVFWRHDGTSVPVEYTSAPIREDGEITGVVCVFADITEQRGRETELREKAAWTKRIHGALRDDRFVLHGQPIVKIPSLEPVRHELLIRMQSAEGTLFPPGDFLPQAERFDLIIDLDRWVVDEAMRIARLQPISVNLSATVLSQPGFADWILEEIVSHEVQPGNLLFEITETAAFQNVGRAHQVVKRLTDLGCGFALDDFGTGYGSFSELRHLPITHLKIDREFVRSLSSSPDDQRVVSSIVAVAKSYGLNTIAEGVEHEESLQILEKLGVDLAQGYYLGRPESLGAEIKG